MKWRDWLPRPQQISNAAQLRPNAYGNSTMQQAGGMIFLLALLAGFLPFVLNWLTAARAGAVLPLAQAAQTASETGGVLVGVAEMLWPVNPVAVTEFYQTLAGLDQPMPGWLAAGLSALGEWINWPLRWLAVWIVYGALVMVANKTLGGHTTLQHFFAATGYAAAPLLLTALSPIPCLGALATLGAVGWALAVYIRANAQVTGLALSRSALAVLLPGPVLGLLALLLTGFLFALSALLML